MLMAPLTLPTHMAAASLLAARTGTPVMVHRGKRDLSGRQRDLEKMRQRMIARYMRCSGLLRVSNHCIENLACRFAAFSDFTKATRLERDITAMLMTNIFNNPHIEKSFKDRMKGAAEGGKKDPTSCIRYRCGLEGTVVPTSGEGKDDATSATSRIKKPISANNSRGIGFGRAKRRKHKHNPPSESPAARIPAFF
ncbi:uncharacterized protein LOC111265439 [Varroa jacobsoni]|uniref:uncharacterized protein LOC111265439 n=1 Tax=Varroa jacobsoni TaxID=62625 RepID=UPI000BF4401F|nr:uncharacterized protein LOC111265439 [Varroa jacobsoni]